MLALAAIRSLNAGAARTPSRPWWRRWCCGGRAHAARSALRDAVTSAAKAGQVWIDTQAMRLSQHGGALAELQSAADATIADWETEQVRCVAMRIEHWTGRA